MFELTIAQDFTTADPVKGYRVGEAVTDPAEVARLLAAPEAHGKVIKVQAGTHPKPAEDQPDDAAQKGGRRGKAD